MEPQNFSCVRGNFRLKWDGWTVCLTWTPAKKRQSLVERRSEDVPTLEIVGFSPIGLRRATRPALGLASALKKETATISVDSE